jgi:GNAT superfamily N-acetyltransferase
MNDIKSQLIARGFRDVDREVWLKDEQRVIGNTKSAPHGFEISMVRTENELEHFLEICTDCFGKEYSDAISIEFSRHQPHKRFSHFIGYRSGHAVAIGSFYSDGTVTVFHNIGVRNEFRNKGFGKAIVNSLCNEHNRMLGYIPLFLQCDGKGFHEKFYNDLGFETFYIRHGYTLDEAGGKNSGG